MWPFVETYWLGAVSLFALTPVGAPPSSEANVAWYAEKSFQKSAQLLGKTLHHQGDISYLEAVNQGAFLAAALVSVDNLFSATATLANAFQRMIELGVILARRSSSAKSVPLMALHPDWVPKRNATGDIEPTGRLWDFLARLGSFRREGKNRRDTATGACLLSCSEWSLTRGQSRRGCFVSPLRWPRRSSNGVRSLALRLPLPTSGTSWLLLNVACSDLASQGSQAESLRGGGDSETAERDEGGRS